MNEKLKEIIELEMTFSNNEYRGSGCYAFAIEEGNIPIMISAPHAVKQYREENIKKADMYTGAIARYLHKATKCHIIYSQMFTKSDPNYDEPSINKYQTELKRYLNSHKIALLIDLHGSSSNRPYAVEMGTVPKIDETSKEKNVQDSSLHQHKFVAENIKTILEDKFKDLQIEQKIVTKNTIFDAGHQNTITKYISENTKTACIQLEINRNYREPNNEEALEALLDGLTEIINRFSIYWLSQI